SEKRVPSIRLEPTILPGTTPPPIGDLPKPTVKPPPRAPEPVVEARREVARSLDDLVSRSEERPAAADVSTSEPKPTRKTSQQLVDEARRRWGMDKRP
ncbi:MAG TPA: hypothetical protein VIH55_02400, partial [Acidimicrobiia bacterium]